uniref:Ig-like domain-containing protein n=1 Tax=Neolamprologus brichardi TaxID=32507 RepID=A0A3Q4GIF2_NEOBR
MRRFSRLVSWLLDNLNNQEIPAVSGQNVSLTCRAPNNNGETVEWSRADLRDKYVLVLKNKKPKEDDQDPSFENRVDLQDKEMKDGNVSLILYNVTAADNGTYECRVLMEETQSLDLICIELSVCVIRGEAASWLLMFVSKDVVDETL